MPGIAEKRVEDILRRSSNGEEFYKCKKACSGNGEGIVNLGPEELKVLKEFSGEACDAVMKFKDRITSAVKKSKGHKVALDSWAQVSGTVQLDPRSKRQFKMRGNRREWEPLLSNDAAVVLDAVSEVKRLLKKNTISFSKNSFVIMKNMLQRCVEETLQYLITKCVSSKKKIVKEQILVTKKRKSTGKKSKAKKTDTVTVLSYDPLEISGLMKLVVQTNAWKRLNVCLLNGDKYSEDSHAKVFTNSMKMVFADIIKNNEDFKGVMLSTSFKALFSDMVEELTRKIGVSLTRSVRYKSMKTVKEYTVMSVLDTLMTFHEIDMEEYRECFLKGVTQKTTTTTEEV